MMVKYLSWRLGHGSTGVREVLVCLQQTGMEEVPPGRNGQDLHMGSGLVKLRSIRYRDPGQAQLNRAKDKLP